MQILDMKSFLTMKAHYLGPRKYHVDNKARPEAVPSFILILLQTTQAVINGKTFMEQGLTTAGCIFSKILYHMDFGYIVCAFPRVLEDGDIQPLFVQATMFGHSE